MGFDEEDREVVAAWREARFEARNQSDSESDISVSSVSTEDLSDLEEEEDEEETWNENPNPVEVSPFTETSCPTSGVAEDGTAIDFFYLMFPEELIEQIVAEINRYAQECIATKPDVSFNVDRVVECCKMELRPQKDLSIDEAMVKFKGRLGMKQYMPMKPIKRGIKVWLCAEASSGFVCDFQVYTGKRQDGTTEQNLGYRVVHDLTRNFTGKNHHVFYDNFFDS